ncbi:MAG: hypothetical protein ACE5JG_07595 [Planctomycetota bacterium]
MALTPLLLAAGILGSLEIDLVRWRLAALHSYDLERMDVVATPRPEGLDVACDLTLTVKRAASSITFVLSSDVEGLKATLGGKPVAAQLGLGGFEVVARMVVAKMAFAPTLLTLQPDPMPPPGRRVTLQLRYRWAPKRGGAFYADADGVQTHNFSFWVPAMADELYDASVRVVAPPGLTPVASGVPGPAPEGRPGVAFVCRMPPPAAAKGRPGQEPRPRGGAVRRPPPPRRRPQAAGPGAARRRPRPGAAGA